jgi:hypothetical protein
MQCVPNLYLFTSPHPNPDPSPRRPDLVHPLEQNITPSVSEPTSHSIHVLLPVYLSDRDSIR